MRRLLPVAVLVLLCTTAMAQPGMTPSIMPPSLTPPTPPPSLRVEQEKNPSIAMLLSIGVTMGGFVMIAAADNNQTLGLLGAGALYFGPSTGQWYAGQFGGLGLGLRALGAVSMMYGVVQILSEDGCDYDCSGSSGDAGAILLISGAGLWVGSSVYDVVLAKRAADSWNAQHSITVLPSVVGSADHRMPGLVLAGRF